MNFASSSMFSFAFILCIIVITPPSIGCPLSVVSLASLSIIFIILFLYSWFTFVSGLYPCSWYPLSTFVFSSPSIDIPTDTLYLLNSCMCCSVISIPFVCTATFRLCLVAHSSMSCRSFIGVSSGSPPCSTISVCPVVFIMFSIDCFIASRSGLYTMCFDGLSSTGRWKQYTHPMLHDSVGITSSVILSHRVVFRCSGFICLCMDVLLYSW